jgi:hypothetical protein
MFGIPNMLQCRRFELSRHRHNLSSAAERASTNYFRIVEIELG